MIMQKQKQKSKKELTDLSSLVSKISAREINRKEIKKNNNNVQKGKKKIALAHRLDLILHDPA
jgi:hypothetical protein